MRLVFSGAAHEVTGSCHYLEVGNTRLLVDCGMEQGANLYENVDPPAPWADIDVVLVTHAHIDHTGMLPYIYARGFRGQVIATPATCDLCRIMLKDSAHIQEMEAEWKNRKARRAGNPEVQPLYEMNDALGLLEHLVPCEYGEIRKVSDEVTVRFTDVGHLLGSASIEVWMNEDGVEKKIVFSGDIGNQHKPLIRDPQYTKEADYVVMESTYGDRLHKKGADHISELVRIVQETLDRGGNVVLPAFAVGRTQELLYFFRHIKAERLVRGHDNFEVYVDSPLAVEATHVFNQNELNCYDDETQDLVRAGINPISFPGLKLSVTSEESKNINFNETPKVIISASGMCDAGRIRHHLKHNLWRKECTVVFAGYQAEGTLGRTLVDGGRSVKLFGEEIEVEAHIEQLHDISGHADQNGLLAWAESFEKKPQQYFIVHGSDSVCDRFAELVSQRTGCAAAAPFSGSEYDLAAGAWVRQTAGVPIVKKTAATKKAQTVFARLVAAGERLLAVISRNEGGTNKDLARFADQINALCDKWDR
ncbi:MAG: MBL fold metallo-hydrolase [Clostridiales bacterium]|nr:MBL fold metallo-hydrolase [Clostridiales bacterium]